AGSIQLSASGSSVFANLFATGGNVTLSGSGSIHLMSSSGGIAHFGTDSPDSLLLNLDNVIHGSGLVEGNVENRGLIVADDPTAPLSIYGIQNTGTLRADGGTLRLSNVSQANNGRIEAINGSAVQLEFADIFGGSLTTNSSGVIRAPNFA